MPDAALSVASSSVSALLTATPADSGAKTHATAGAADPFAALLAGANGGKTAPEPDKTPAKTHAADPVTVQVADKPVVATAPAAAAPATATNAGQPSAQPSPTRTPPDEADAPPPAHQGKRDSADEDDTDDADDGSDRLADAIASGATAVLALAPSMVAPIQTPPPAPTPTPVKIDAQTALKPLKPASLPGLPTHLPRSAPDPIETTANITDIAKSAEAVQAQPQTAPSAAQPMSGPVIGTPTDPRLKPDTAAKAAEAEAAANGARIAARDQRGTSEPQANPDTLPQTNTQPQGRGQPQPQPQPQPQQQQQQQQQPQQHQTTPTAETAPAARQLPPEIAKTVAAVLTQGKDAPEAAAEDPANPIATSTTFSALAAAKTELAQKDADPQNQSVKPMPPQTETVPPQAQAPRHRSEEAPAPRRASEPRKRTEPVPAELASTGAAPRATETVHPAAGLAAGDVQGKGDSLVEQTLAIARDGAWLDRLARDIASAGKGGELNFKLAPQNLGALSVAISQSAGGASIRLTADNDKTRDILIDAQPKLIAEAHAQGLKVADTQVDVRQDQNRGQNQSSNQDAQRWAQNGAGQNNMSQNGQNRQSSPGHQPFVSNLRRKAEADSESPDRDSDVLYA